MDIHQLENLLQQSESERLEFKRELRLNTKAGKAKLLKEVLAMANVLPPGKRAWLLIGVDDDGRVIGLQHPITEEQVQQILREWCRPPIGVHFEIQEYRHKRLGVLTISNSRPPHTLNRDFKTTQDGKPIELLEKDVYVRRGSTVDTATAEEVIHMAQSRQSNLDEIVTSLDEIQYQFRDVAFALDGFASSLSDSPNRLIETAFIGMLVGIMLSLLGIPFSLYPLFLVISIFSWATALTALHLLHFGIMRMFFTALIFPPIYCLLISQSEKLLPGIFNQPFAAIVLYLAGMGWISGVVTALILSHMESRIRV